MLSITMAPGLIFLDEIICRFGGAYVDINMEYLKLIYILHDMYDFYTGI
jgi:hypothetical protein